MKYTIVIDQLSAIEWGLNLTEAAVFDFLYSVPSWADAKEIGSHIYFLASRNKAIAEIPVVSDKPDTLYRIYRQLEDKGLILYLKDGRNDMIRLTDKGKTWNSEKNPGLTDNPEKNPGELGKKSEKPRKKIRQISILDNNDTNDNYLVESFLKDLIAFIDYVQTQMLIQLKKNFSDNIAEAVYLIEANTFVEYWQSRSWRNKTGKIKDFDATVGTWARNGFNVMSNYSKILIKQKEQEAKASAAGTGFKRISREEQVKPSLPGFKLDEV
jgi:DNA-binding PadR family transcriptional regulator